MTDSTGIFSSFGRDGRQKRGPGYGGLTETNARIGFIILSALTAAKGILPSTHNDEMYFWLVNYQYGLTRRALVGSILSPLVETMTRNQLAVLLRLMALAAFLVLLVFVWQWLMALRGRFSEQTIYLFGLLFATSPFLGLLAYHVGYPDDLVVMLVIAGALALRYACLWMLVLVLVAAAFIHELALLILLPLSAWGALNCRHWSTRHALMLGVAGAACCLMVIYEGHASPALIDSLIKHLEALGVGHESATFQVRASLTQGVVQTISMMRHVLADDASNAIMETLYGASTGAIILCLAFPNFRRSVAGRDLYYRCFAYALFLASGLSPVFLLALAFDTSRLASFSTLTALVTVGLFSFKNERAHQNSLGLKPAYALAALAYLACPIMDLHPWYAQPVNLRRVSFVCSPCGKLGLAFADLINRKRTAQQRIVIDSDTDYGN
jgi:hypothetical protein